MPTVSFTQNIQRHVACPSLDVEGKTLREVMDAVWEQLPAARGYILDETGAVRRHVVIFVDGEGVKDRDGLGDPVKPNSEIYVMQALSGG